LKDHSFFVLYLLVLSVAESIYADVKIPSKRWMGFFIPIEVLLLGWCRWVVAVARCHLTIAAKPIHIVALAYGLGERYALATLWLEGECAGTLADVD
jgi:hypothetical protein